MMLISLGLSFPDEAMKLLKYHQQPLAFRFRPGIVGAYLRKTDWLAA
jgi:hypothetical protein